jgi:PleD family two-component response regulator
MAVQLAERIREIIARRPVRSPTSEVPITCSLGVAQATPASMSLIELAEKALVRARS